MTTKKQPRLYLILIIALSLCVYCFGNDEVEFEGNPEEHVLAERAFESESSKTAEFDYADESTQDLETVEPNQTPSSGPEMKEQDMVQKQTQMDDTTEGEILAPEHSENASPQEVKPIGKELIQGSAPLYQDTSKQN